MEWSEQAQQAEQSGDWDAAVSLVSAHAECYSTDHYAHDNHLWHMDLLARADRLTELSELARTDVHARRRLNRSLRSRGMETMLRERAEDGDRDALYCLVRRLCETSRTEQARHTVAEIAPENQHAQEIIIAAEASFSQGA
ncbi:hypothetical protein [Streptacidiphilus jiangxiensis]|uniref:Tetratricopeptide repeat-containing protein n=1 Tax=Streptacidiphilus jiangxiensis TaxID=235985 RepID=A0A1H7PDA0_STRJI|nr:hypothetical protein [Streptacidiphilus jiangxiensis]SEL33394.1 hypothetical protein SAMN05414137_107320 [Streptacidiphilus jiangxiensis]